MIGNNWTEDLSSSACLRLHHSLIDAGVSIMYCSASVQNLISVGLMIGWANMPCPEKPLCEPDIEVHSVD